MEIDWSEEKKAHIYKRTHTMVRHIHEHTQHYPHTRSHTHTHSLSLNTYTYVENDVRRGLRGGIADVLRLREEVGVLGARGEFELVLCEAVV
jgi:hypothetical protein